MIDKRKFVEMMAKVSLARQADVLNQKELDVYWEMLSCYDEDELNRAIKAACASEYHNFPNVGEFITAICGDRMRLLPAYNPWGRHEDYLPQKMSPAEFHSERKRKAELQALKDKGLANELQGIAKALGSKK